MPNKFHVCLSALATAIVVCAFAAEEPVVVEAVDFLHHGVDGGKDPATSELLDTAARTIKSCRTDLRRCLWDLRNDVLDEPSFAEAIRQTVAPVSGEASLAVSFSGPRQYISDAIAHGTLNIVRELVANAKLGASSRTEAVATAFRRRLLKS